MCCCSVLEDFKLLNLSDDIHAVHGGINLLINPADDALFIDEHRHARRGLVGAIGRVVEDGGVTAGIGQKWKRQFQKLGKSVWYLKICLMSGILQAYYYGSANSFPFFGR